MVTYLKNKKNIIGTFLKHVGNTSVMDFLLKVIASEDSPEGTGILEVIIIVIIRSICNTHKVALHN
jgi:hypothetical protein